MRSFGALALAGSVLLGNAALAQDAAQFEAGWRKVDGGEGGYVNSATLMRCPLTLGEGYNLFRADVYASSTDVSCGYKLSDDSALISFYFYPAQGSVAEEIASTSRPVLDRSGPRTAQREGQRDWALPTGAIKAVSLEVTPTDGEGQSFAIADVAGRRMKARETWTGTSTVSHRIADSFFALQTEALANARTCAAIPKWGATSRARLTRDPGAGATIAGFVVGLLGAAVEASDNKTPATTCILGSFGSSNDGGNLVLSRSGPFGVATNLDNQPATELVAGIASLVLADKAPEPGDPQFALYARNGNRTAVFRTYLTQPSWDQLLADLGSVATDALEPLTVVDFPEGGNVSISVNQPAVDAEKAKRRPGSR